MKAKVSAIVLGALGVAALAGCGQESPQNSNDAQKPENQLKGSMTVPEEGSKTNEGGEAKPMTPQ